MRDTAPMGCHAQGLNRMRYILQLFYAPAIRTLPEAQATTARRREATASHLARFSGFVEAASSVQPGLFVPSQMNDAVLGVSMAAAPPREQLVRLARAAAMAGLHLLDPQSQTLYRADGCVVYANGSVAPMPSPPVAAPPPWNKSAVAELVTRRITACIVAHGFSPEADGRLVRQHGDVQQGISCYVGEQAGALLGHTRFHFRCREVWQVWHDALGHQNGSTTTPDLTLTAVELANGRPPSHHGNAWRTLQEVEHWLDAFDRWFVEAALPRLDRMSRAADLAELALSEAQMQVLPRRRQMTSGERFSRLVLAAAFDATRLPDWETLLCKPRQGDGPAERGQLKQLAAYLRS